MPSKKSPFLSAAGTTFQILKALVDEVLSQGGDDESLRLILTDEAVRKSVANILVNAGKPVVVPEKPKLLAPLDTVAIPATVEKFVVAKHFKDGTTDGVTCWVGSNFQSWFDAKVEDPMSAVTLRGHQLLRSSVDGPIIAELGGEAKVETTMSAIWALLKKQSKGQTGTLLVNGYANIFYVRDAKGVLRAVGVDWNGGGWGVAASPVEGPSTWDGDGRVFSRDS